jgi:histidyl-tRNA synthetase
MRDLLPDEAEKLRFIEQSARETARLYGYREAITPILEHYELLAAKVGEENRNRMYAFEDMGGRKVALRPEFTASIARLVATKMPNVPRPIRLFCTGSLYRYDEPQFGRYREFWQVNYELFGSIEPEADAEVLSLTNSLIEKLGLRDYQFKIGHVGILRGILSREGIAEEQQDRILQLLDKKQWDEALELTKQVGGPQKCLSTLKNLFEIKDEDPDKVTREIRESVKEYPEALAATENLHETLRLLTASCKVKMSLEAGFARGLDYYTGLIFEVYVPEMTVALGGGGRYDRLIELFGGDVTPAVGVALGVDRLALALEKQGAAQSTGEEKRVLVVPVGDEMVGAAFTVSSLLRKSGVCTEMEAMGRSVSKALSDADRRGITHAVIVGPKENKEGKAVLRTMKERKQETVNIEELPEKVKR